jgi:hypothetical protein
MPAANCSAATGARSLTIAEAAATVQAALHQHGRQA